MQGARKAYEQVLIDPFNSNDARERDKVQQQQRKTANRMRRKLQKTSCSGPAARLMASGVDGPADNLSRSDGRYQRLAADRLTVSGAEATHLNRVVEAMPARILRRPLRPFQQCVLIRIG